jgi:aminoglycoside phosphotransferase (APT) family kinase protein
MDSDVGPVPERYDIDVPLVRRLIAAQFPQWADLPIRPVAPAGWDNRTFHLGAHLVVRMPSAPPYALAVDKEHRWLPALAPHLPLPIPVPLTRGEPGEGYPHHWSVYRWIDGQPASRHLVDDPMRFAVALAGFLVALRRIDPTGGPPPGLHNWFRGGPLRTYEAGTRRALEALDGRVPTDLATEIWRSALDSAWDGPPVWFHGDVAAGNLLIRDGALAAVIDFGTCGVGDPACDVVIAWTLLSGASRDAFRDGLGVDPATWARGRGWALWKALVTYAGARDTDPAQAAEAERVLAQIFTEYQATG